MADKPRKWVAPKEYKQREYLSSSNAGDDKPVAESKFKNMFIPEAMQPEVQKIRNIDYLNKAVENSGVGVVPVRTFENLNNDVAVNQNYGTIMQQGADETKAKLNKYANLLDASIVNTGTGLWNMGGISSDMPAKSIEGENKSTGTKQIIAYNPSLQAPSFQTKTIEPEPATKLLTEEELKQYKGFAGNMLGGLQSMAERNAEYKSSNKPLSDFPDLEKFLKAKGMNYFASGSGENPYYNDKKVLESLLSGELDNYAPPQALENIFQGLAETGIKNLGYLMGLGTGMLTSNALSYDSQQSDIAKLQKLFGDNVELPKREASNSEEIVKGIASIVGMLPAFAKSKESIYTIAPFLKDTKAANELVQMMKTGKDISGMDKLIVLGKNIGNRILGEGLVMTGANTLQDHTVSPSSFVTGASFGTAGLVTDTVEAILTQNKLTKFIKPVVKAILSGTSFAGGSYINSKLTGEDVNLLQEFGKGVGLSIFHSLPEKISRSIQDYKLSEQLGIDASKVRDYINNFKATNDVITDKETGLKYNVSRVDITGDKDNNITHSNIELRQRENPEIVKQVSFAELQDGKKWDYKKPPAEEVVKDEPKQIEAPVKVQGDDKLKAFLEEYVAPVEQSSSSTGSSSKNIEQEIKSINPGLKDEQIQRMKDAGFTDEVIAGTGPRFVEGLLRGKEQEKLKVEEKNDSPQSTQSAQSKSENLGKEQNITKDITNVPKIVEKAKTEQKTKQSDNSNNITKQPWEMTKDAFDEATANGEDLTGWNNSPDKVQADKLLKEAQILSKSKNKEVKSKGDELVNASQLIADTFYEANTHETQIKKAISEGKSVPAEVLKDYPELQTNKKIETTGTEEPVNNISNELNVVSSVPDSISNGKVETSNLKSKPKELTSIDKAKQDIEEAKTLREKAPDTAEFDSGIKTKDDYDKYIKEVQDWIDSKGKKKPVKNEKPIAEHNIEKIAEMPRHTLPENLSKGILEGAKDFKKELESAEITKVNAFSTNVNTVEVDGVVADKNSPDDYGQDNKRTFNGMTVNTYPDWFTQKGWNKKSVIVALDKIIKDNGADKGKLVEEVKKEILGALENGREQHTKFVKAGVTSKEHNYTVPKDAEIAAFLQEFKDKKVTKKDLHKAYKTGLEEENKYYELKARDLNDAEKEYYNHLAEEHAREKALEENNYEEASSFFKEQAVGSREKAVESKSKEQELSPQSSQSAPSKEQNLGKEKSKVKALDKEDYKSIGMSPKEIEFNQIEAFPDEKIKSLESKLPFLNKMLDPERIGGIYTAENLNFPHYQLKKDTILTRIEQIKAQKGEKKPASGELFADNAQKDEKKPVSAQEEFMNEKIRKGDNSQAVKRQEASNKLKQEEKLIKVKKQQEGLVADRKNLTNIIESENTSDAQKSAARNKLEEIDKKIGENKKVLSNGDMFGGTGDIFSEDAPVVAAKKETVKESTDDKEKLEDFGEKIGGARKDEVKKYFDKINLNGKILSVIFPKPDIKALLDSGLSVKDVAGIKVAHEFARQDKKKGDRVMKFYAAYAKNILAESINLEYKNEGYTFTDYGKSQIELRTKAYRAVHKELGADFLALDLTKVRIKEPDKDGNTTYFENGKPVKDVNYIVSYYVSRIKYHTNLEDAINDFVEQVRANTKTDAVEYKHKLSVYQDRRNSKDGYYIAFAPKGKELIKLREGLKTTKEAFEILKDAEALAAMHLQLERILAENKEQNKKTVTRLKYSNETARERVGKDWRNGKDVGSKELAETFGFRAIEFGNWVNQKERQVFINNSYDSLMDLAQLLNIPTKAISLAGNLGITFGSRGSGNASAHFEPERRIINLTKTKGLGSLAHEWWHAVDNYFTDFKTNAKGMQAASNLEFKTGVREEIKTAFNKLYNAVNTGDMKKRSNNLDSSRNRNYFSLSHEMSARAFENYILKRLNESGQVNDFIVNYISNDDWNGEADKYPFPTGEEAVKINDAFQELIDTFETEEKDGKTPIFQRKAGDVFYSQLERVAEAKIQNNGTPAQIKATLLNNGVKQAEYDWLGLDEFMAGKDKVSKKELMDFIGENKVVVKSISKGESKWVGNVLVDNGDSLATVTENEDGTYSFTSDFSEGEETFPTKRLAMEEAELSVLGTYSDAGTKFGNYKTEGGKNYREVLLTLPDLRNAPTFKKWHAGEIGNTGKYIVADENHEFCRRCSSNEIREYTSKAYAEEVAKGLSEAPIYDMTKPFSSSHFDEPNIALHLRLQDFKDGKKKVLLIDEVQSDWGQKGRKEGYIDNTRNAVIDKKLAEIKKNLEGMFPNAHFQNILNDYPDLTLVKEFREIGKELHKNRDAVPDMPFKKNWQEVGMKWALRYAAENGYDSVAWTTGEQQAERYDLSKHIDSIRYDKDAAGEYEIRAVKDGDVVLTKDNIAEKELENIVGKEVAQKIINDEGKAPEKGSGNYHKTLSGLDLKVGDKGMSGFYDKILPDFMNKYVKKWGSSVKSLELGVKSSKIGDDDLLERYEALEDSDTGKWGVFTQGGEDIAEGFKSEKEATDWILANMGEAQRQKFHSLDITDAMRESVMEGQPLFQKSLENKGQSRSLESTPIREHPELMKQMVKRMLKAFPDKGKDDVVITGTSTEFFDTLLEQEGYDSRKLDKGYAPLAYVGSDGRIHIDGERATLDAPVHEFGHVWVDWAKRNAPELLKQGYKLVEQDTDLMDETRRLYPDLSRERQYEEALVAAITRKADGMYENIMNEGKRKTLWEKFKRWVKGLYDRIFGTDKTFDEYMESRVKDLFYGKFEIGKIKDFTTERTEKNITQSTQSKRFSGLEQEQPDMMVAAWHGSPHDIKDKFSTNKIGTGEGAQAFGWGLYFTDLEGIARGYADKLVNYNVELNGKRLNEDVIFGRSIKYDNYGFDALAKILINKDKPEFNNFWNDLEKRIVDNWDSDFVKADRIQQIKDDIKIYSKNFNDLKVTGAKNLYKVKLHEGKTPEQYDWLEWDKPVSEKNKTKIKEQGIKEGLDKIQNFGQYSNPFVTTVMVMENKNIKGYGKFKEGDVYHKSFLHNIDIKYREQHTSFDPGRMGFELYAKLENLFKTDKEASLFLLRAGIDGVRYPAETMARGTTSETARGFNYVVFDENAITIEEHIKFQRKRTFPSRSLGTRGENAILTKEEADGLDLAKRMEKAGKSEEEIFERTSWQKGKFDGKWKVISNLKVETGNLKSEEQTDSPKFKKWFGDSKVVDENGKPLVVYHGGRNDFTEYKVPAWFTPSPEDADFYAMERRIWTEEDWDPKYDGEYSELAGMKGANLMPVYLKIKNFLDLTQKDVTDQPSLAEFVEYLPNDFINEEEYFNLTGYSAFANPTLFEWIEHPEFLKAMKRNKYDGIKAKESGFTNFMVLASNQIKSATGNNGEFSTENNDIRFQRKGDSSTEQWFEDNRDLLELLGKRVLRENPSLDDMGFLAKMNEMLGKAGAGVTELSEEQSGKILRAVIQRDASPIQNSEFKVQNEEQKPVGDSAPPSKNLGVRSEKIEEQKQEEPLPQSAQSSQSEEQNLGKEQSEIPAKSDAGMTPIDKEQKKKGPAIPKGFDEHKFNVQVQKDEQFGDVEKELIAKDSIYKIQPNKETHEAAVNEIEKLGGDEAAYTALIEKGNFFRFVKKGMGNEAIDNIPGEVKIEMGLIVLRRFQDKVNKSGLSAQDILDGNADAQTVMALNKSLTMARHLMERGMDVGRQVQIFATFGKLSPEGLLLYAKKVERDTNRERQTRTDGNVENAVKALQEENKKAIEELVRMYEEKIGELEKALANRQEAGEEPGSSGTGSSSEEQKQEIEKEVQKAVKEYKDEIEKLKKEMTGIHPEAEKYLSDEERAQLEGDKKLLAEIDRLTKELGKKGLEQKDIEDIIKKLQDSIPKVDLGNEDGGSSPSTKGGGSRKPPAKYKPVSEMTEEERHADILQKAQDKLAKRVADTFKVKLPPSEEQVLINEMVSTLFNVAQEQKLVDVPDKKDPEPIIDRIGRAVRGDKDYKDVWEKAKAIVKQRLAKMYKDIPKQELGNEGIEEKYDAAINRLEDYFKHTLKDAFTENQVKRALRDRMKTDNVKIGELIRKHYTEVAGTARDLADKLIQDAGLTKEEGEGLAAEVQKQMQVLTAEAKAKALANAINPVDRKPGKAKRVFQQLIEASNMGFLNNAEAFEILKRKYDWKELTPVHAKRIMEFGDEIKNLPEGSVQQVMKIAEMMNYVKNSLGFKKTEFVWSMFYANQLSGMYTHIKNVRYNVINSAIEFMIRNPKEYGAAMDGAMKGLLGEGWNDFKFAMQHGSAGLSSGKFENDDIIAQSITERYDWKDVKNNPVKWGLIYAKYVMRALYAEDRLSFGMTKEMEAYSLAFIQAKNDLSPKNLSFPPEERLRLKNLSKKEMDKLIRARMEVILNNGDVQVTKMKMQAEKEGLKPGTTLFNKRVYQLMEQGREPEMVAATHKFGAWATLNYEPVGVLGGVYRAFEYLRRQPGGYYSQSILPYIKITANVMNNLIDYTPNGYKRAFFGYTGDETRPSPRELKKELTRATAGSLMLGALIALASKFIFDDDKEADKKWRITTVGTGNNAKNKQLEQTGWKQFSIYVPGMDKWVSYLDTPLQYPLTALGLISDLHHYQSEKLDDETWMANTGYVLTALLTSSLNQSFMQGLKDMMGAFDDSNPGKMGTYLMRYSVGLGLSLTMPNMIRQLARTIDTSQYEGTGFVGSYLRSVGIAEDALGLKPKLNVLGEQIKGDRTPMYSDNEHSKVWEFIVDNETYISPPKEDTKIYDPNLMDVLTGKKGMDRTLTQDEYYRFVKESGTAIKQGIESGLDELNKVADKDRLRKYVKYLTQTARDGVKEQIALKEMDKDNAVVLQNFGKYVNFKEEIVKINEAALKHGIKTAKGEDWSYKPSNSIDAGEGDDATNKKFGDREDRTLVVNRERVRDIVTKKKSVYSGEYKMQGDVEGFLRDIKY